MKGKTSTYARQMVSIPSVVIAVGWVMLWFLWPHGVKVVARPHVSGAARVAFVKATENPFSRPMPMHVWQAAGSGDDSVIVAPWLVPRPAKVLERNMLNPDDLTGARLADASDIANLRNSAYRPVWNDRSVFKDIPHNPPHLTVEPSADLAERGFLVPAFGGELKKADKPWMVTAFVQVDAKGKVAGVFLENSSESREINSTVIRSLYRGTVTNAGTPCEGRVKVNFGQD